MSLSSDYLIQLWHQFDRWERQAKALLGEIKTRPNVVLAIDFSELYQYMYTNQDRHQMVSHIIKNVDRELTLPPGTCYELLWHANSTIGRPDEDKWRSIEQHKSVERFLREFNEAEGHAEAQMKAYQNVDKSMRVTLEQIASITRPESPWNRINELLGMEFLQPLGNFVEVNEIKLNLEIEGEVRKQLEADRPHSPYTSNIIDSLNFVVIHACNEWQHKIKAPKSPNVYYVVFTGSPRVAEAYAKYTWRNQNIVRQAEYLKIMANLNKNVAKDAQQAHLTDCIQLIKDLKNLIFTALGPLAAYIRNLEADRKVERIDLPIEVIDKFKRFDDEYYYPLFSLELEDAQTEMDSARELYDFLFATVKLKDKLIVTPSQEGAIANAGSDAEEHTEVVREGNTTHRVGLYERICKLIMMPQFA